LEEFRKRSKKTFTVLVLINALKIRRQVALIKDFVGDLIKGGIGEKKIFFKVDKVVADGGLGVGFGFKPSLIGNEDRGSHKRGLFPEPNKGGSND